MTKWPWTFAGYGFWQGAARGPGAYRPKPRAPLEGLAAVFIAAWQEDKVIGHTIRHALAAWRQEGFTLYVGCYGNDPATVHAAMEAARGDTRVRVVIHDKSGPTTKADCLNRLYFALCDDEQRRGRRYRGIVLHDSEDMVHPAELAVMDRALETADFVQLPVRPEPQRDSRWVGGHYIDEFTEAHAKAMIVRDALGAGVPAAGVACGFGRDMLDRIARLRQAEGGHGPFASECLTEDYELGLLVSRENGRSRFLRIRDEKGALVATRAYFPAELRDSVRQKTRWIHGIAFQGWERLGWNGRPVAKWMALRDRRGPLTALVLASSYALVIVSGLRSLFQLGGFSVMGSQAPQGMHAMLPVIALGLVWRCVFRAGFTAREYGLAEGFRAILRIPVANFISIMAGRDAFASYVRTLRGGAVTWQKTRHDSHPAMAMADGVAL